MPFSRWWLLAPRSMTEDKAPDTVRKKRCLEVFQVSQAVECMHGSAID